MIKPGGNIDALPLGDNTYKLMDTGRIISNAELIRLESEFNRRQTQDNVKKTVSKIRNQHLSDIKKCAKHMISVGISFSRVNRFVDTRVEEMDKNINDAIQPVGLRLE